MRAGSVLLLPALGVSVSRYEALAEELRQRLGLPVDTLVWPEPRGWADRLGGRPEVGYRDLMRQVLSHADEAEARHPGRGVILVGHSLGGQLAMLAAGHGLSAAGIVLVACGTSHWRAWPEADRTRMHLSMVALAVLIALLPWYPGAWLGFGGHQSRRLMRDWSMLARCGRFDAMRCLAGAEAHMAAAAPTVLALSVEGDAYAPPSTTDALLAKLPLAVVQHRRIDAPAWHGADPVRRHIAWLHDPAPVAEAIADWWAQCVLAQAH